MGRRDQADHALRTRLGARSALATAWTSRRLGLGDGSTIGGRIGLLLAPDLVAALGRGRRSCLVSGTNGKTTTTRLIAEALGGPDAVATSVAGANLPAGIAAALAAAEGDASAVLEVDEGYLVAVAERIEPDVVVLTNLSHDQLDRVSEVRMVAERWRLGLAGTAATVVANADDPLVAFAASGAEQVLWVSAGARWHADAYHCPRCDARITFAVESLDLAGAKPPSVAASPPGWSCANCGFARPEPDAWLEGDELVLPTGRHLLRLALPGHFNAANAAMAVVAAGALGVPVEAALIAVGSVGEVAGRFAKASYAGIEARLLLAKNPAGWAELLALVTEDDRPSVVSINARIADGHDPSWLWDVPFESLAGRFVVATGERRHDLAVRLRHAGVDHIVVASPRRALVAAGGGGERVDVIANYTAFQDLRRQLGRSRTVRSDHARSRRAAGVRSTSGPPTHRVRPDRLVVVVVHPDLLGTYGDGGNGRVLADRARWHGYDVELLLAPSDEALPAQADLYCLGGGEDGPQLTSARLLRAGPLAGAVGGAVVFAVCAGYQVIGESFPGADGATERGAGLLEVTTERSALARAVGELRTRPLAAGLEAGGELSGFENHAGRTRLGSSAKPLGEVELGVGNGFGRTDGAVAGHVVGTYLHGPALARNPKLADLLLGLATGDVLAPLDDAEEEQLRAERRRATSSRRRRRRDVSTPA